VGPQYGPGALAVTRAVAALLQYGVQVQDLRVVKDAANREATMVAQVVARQLRQRDPGVISDPIRTRRELTELTWQLLVTLVEADLASSGGGPGLAEAGEMRITEGR
jgi:hypothetical protein